MNKDFNEEKYKRKLRNEFNREEQKEKKEKQQKKIKYEKEIKRPGYKIDTMINLLIDKDGIINLSDIIKVLNGNIFLESSSEKFLLKTTRVLKDWANREVNKSHGAFIQGFNSKHPNALAIGKALISGFLDDKDIQKDLGLKSVKQADRILSPLPNNYISNEGKWSNKFRIRNIIKVWHVRQYTTDGPRIYGLNKRPKKVVSTVDYIHFLLNDYKNSPTRKYAKNYYTKIGQHISSEWDESSNQHRKQVFLRNYAYGIAEDNLVQTLTEILKLKGMECACLNTRIRYMSGLPLDNPEEIFEANKIYNDICPKINEKCKRADWIKQSMENMSFLDIIRKKHPNNTRSRLLNEISNGFKDLGSHLTKVERMFFEGQLRWRGHIYGHIERR